MATALPMRLCASFRAVRYALAATANARAGKIDALNALRYQSWTYVYKCVYKSNCLSFTIIYN